MTIWKGNTDLGAMRSLVSEYGNGTLGGGGVADRPAGTALVLDASAAYGVLSIAGVTALTVSGTKKGAQATMLVVADGTNIPTISGADEWASSFGYLNTAGVPNLLTVWHDGVARRYAWSQQMTPAAIDLVAPTISSAAVNGATLTVTWSESPAAAPVASAFSVIGAGGVTQTPSAVSQAGAVTTLTLATAAVSGNTVTMSVTAGAVADAAGNASAAVTGRAVTNNTGLSADTDVSDWLSRVAANGGSVATAIQNAVTAFVTSAKTNGYWSTLTRVNLFAGDQAAAMLVPLVKTVGSTLDTAVGTLTYAATGISTDGSTGYIRTGVVPSTATGGLSVYLRTTQASDTTPRIPIGCRDSGTTQVYRIIGNADGSGATSAGSVSSQWGIGAPGGTSAAAGGLVAAFWHVRRTAATVLSLFKNGASVGTSATSVTPASPTNDIAIFGGYNGSAASGMLASGSSVAGYAVDSGMTDAQAALFRTDMQTFQAALSRSV